VYLRVMGSHVGLVVSLLTFALVNKQHATGRKVDTDVQVAGCCKQADLKDGDNALQTVGDLHTRNLQGLPTSLLEIGELSYLLACSGECIAI
jgi:hypothetical protein